MSETRFGICTFCDAVCGLQFEVEGDRITKVRGDRDDVFSKGHICPKGVAQMDLHNDPERLRTPVRRNGDRWDPIPWNDAYDLVAERFSAIQKASGDHAVGFYFGNPAGHDYKGLFAALTFARLLGSRNVYSSNSVDAHPRMLASFALYGNQALLPVPDIERTDLLVVMGANPAISNGSVMTGPDMRKRLKAIRKRGGRMVVIDPRRTETAAMADEHLFIEPGTDALLLLSVIEALDRNGLVDDSAREHADGVDTLLGIARDYPAKRTSPVTRVPEQAVEQLAVAFGRAPTAVWYGRMGTSTQAFGCVSTWLIDAINVLTGNCDRPGGAMFGTPAVDLGGIAALIRETGAHGRWHSRVGGLPEFNGELPVAALADEIETPGPGRIEAMLIYGANPVLSNPNGVRLSKALQSLDFLVCIDFYINDTTRHADLVLPPCPPLERAHYPMLELSMGVRNIARYAHPVMPGATGLPEDSEILVDILGALLPRRSMGGWMLGRAVSAGFGLVDAEWVLAALLRFGPQRLKLADVKEARHGIDLGALEPRLAAAIRTPSRRIQLAPPRMLADLPRLRARIDAEPPTLSLVSRRTLRSMNSWLNDFTRLAKGKDRCTLQIHPDDAAAAGLSGAERARVRSRVGAIEVPLEITEQMMPGVVSLPHGWRKASMNDLVDERGYDAVSGTTILDGVPVTVEAL